MVVYSHDDSNAVDRELGLLLFCWDYWEKEIRKEIEDAVSEVCVKRESVDDWVKKLLCEQGQKEYSGYRRRRWYCDNKQ